MTRLLYAFVCPVLLAYAACTDPLTPTTSTIYFELDAPLCSSLLPMEFKIDDALVGVDTFRVNYGPNHTKSRAFSVSPGSHKLGARVADGYVWPDTIVQLNAGAAFTDSLPFYCS